MQKKIVIIGASSGIGKEMALSYAQQHHLVCTTGRREALLEETKYKFPTNIITAAFDVTKSNNQQQLQAIIEKMNGLDLLIYNAGYGEPSERLDWELDKRIVDTNVNGFIEIVNFCFNYFLRHDEGQIAITSSIAALRGSSHSPAYSASKAFMSNYAEGLNSKARRLGKQIIVTDIKPGFLNTKPASDYKRFWTADPKKAAGQIIEAIEKKKRVAYITKRWWLVAQVMKLIPYSIYRRIG